MTDAGFFRGTSAEQDNRFSDKHKKLLKQMKFADSLSLKVDTSKVDLDVLRPWVAKRVTDILGMEDEVVAEFVMNQLEADKTPDPKTMQINLTGFLNARKAREFMGELWTLLHSASNSPNGIPEQLIEAKKQEILAREEAKKDMSNDVLPELQTFNGSSTQAPTQVENSKKTRTNSPSPKRKSDPTSPNSKRQSVSPRRRSRSPRKSRSPERRRSRSPRHHHGHHHHHHRHHRKHSSHRKRHYRDDSRSDKSRRRDRERERERDEKSRREKDRDREKERDRERDARHRSKKSRYSSSPSVTSDSSSSSSASSSSSSHHHKSSSSRHRRRRSRSREGKSSRSSPSRSHGSKSSDHHGQNRRMDSERKKKSPSPLEEELNLMRETALKSLRNK